LPKAVLDVAKVIILSNLNNRELTPEGNVRHRPAAGPGEIEGSVQLTVR